MPNPTEIKKHNGKERSLGDIKAEITMLGHVIPERW